MQTSSRRRFVLSLAALGATTALTACAGRPMIAVTERSDPVASVSPAQAREALNAMRRERDLPEIEHDPLLQRVADEQLGIMVRTSRISHAAERDQGFMTRLRRADFWGAAGENLAGGPPNLNAVIAGWLNSPPHRRVMVNPDYRRFGLAYGRGPSTSTNTYGTYWALVMGMIVPPGATRA